MRILIFLLLALSPIHAADAWPPKPFTHVVAYCYDYIRDSRGKSIVFADGTHHAGIIAPFTTRLGTSQAEKLTSILNTDKYDGDNDCYDPHHGFVFYDKDWNPVASISICFHCSVYASSPPLTVDAVSTDALQALAKELGLPLLEDLGDYQKLFNKHHLPKPGVKAPVPPSDGGINDDPFAPR